MDRRHRGTPAPPTELHGHLPPTYEELRSMAGRLLRRRPTPDPLRTTSLVHETYLKLAHTDRVSFRDRGHFLALASRAMRWVLIDRTRHRFTMKRRANGQRVRLADEQIPGELPSDGFLSLHEALARLAIIDPRKARTVELRFFGGLDLDETANALDVSIATVKRDWAFARAWLYREIRSD